MSIIEARVELRPEERRRGAWVIGRNGTRDVSSVSVCSGGESATVEVTGARGRTLRAGFSIPAKRMDELAMRWLQARGLVMPAVMAEEGG